MGRAALLALLGVAFLSIGVARADTDALSYDDPGMHFRPPDGWLRFNVQKSEDADRNGPVVVAAYLDNAKKDDPRRIIITVEPWDGSLEGFENSHESDLRNGGKSQSTFIDHKELTKLANGMPAYFMRVNVGDPSGQFARSYEYVIIDKQRGIVASYGGRAGFYDAKDPKDAKAALASLYVVVYPKPWNP